MAALVAEFVAVITTLYTFVEGYLVPATVADVNIIHVAIWTPVIIGLISLVVTLVKAFFASRQRDSDMDSIADEFYEARYSGASQGELDAIEQRWADRRDSSIW